MNGIWTQGSRMEGADESTELRWHPTTYFIVWSNQAKLIWRPAVLWSFHLLLVLFSVIDWLGEMTRFRSIFETISFFS